MRPQTPRSRGGQGAGLGMMSALGRHRPVMEPGQSLKEPHMAAFSRRERGGDSKTTQHLRGKDRMAWRGPVRAP